MYYLGNYQFLGQFIFSYRNWIRLGNTYKNEFVNYLVWQFIPLAPNDVYIGRTAQLTSRRCILNIYSTNTRGLEF